MGVPEILDKWGNKTREQVIDMLGLQGDSVDNIPGIPGISPNYREILEEYDSYRKPIEHGDELKGQTTGAR